MDLTSVKQSVLVVEDDPDFLATLSKFLQNKGFKVITAANGAEAMVKIGNQFFDAILCDITMPRMTGDEFVEQVKKSRYNAKTPVIVLSGHLDRRVIDRIRPHVKRAFTKPADLEVVTSYLVEILKSEPVKR